MARTIGPDEASRTVYTIAGGALRSAAGLTGTVYTDVDGTTLADILTQPGGVTISGSQLIVDAFSRLPLIQFPDGVDTLYVSVNGGPLTPMYARTDDRLDSLTTGLAAKAPTASPAFTGTPTAPTATAGTGTNQLATTAFAGSAVATQAAAEAARRASDGWVRTAIRTTLSSLRLPRAAAPLTIPTYVGSETVHPSVYFDAAGWNGYRYWMAMTPYGGTDNQVENPSIVVSRDGDTWIVPPGLTNPIEPAPGNGPNSYNSDPDLVMGPAGVLYMFWRTVNVPTGSETIYYRTSTDGITWLPKVSSLVSPFVTRRMVSPAVLYDDVTGVWTMFGIETLQSPNVLSKWTATAPAGPWTRQACTAAISGRDLWHMDVVRWSGEYHMLLSDCNLDTDGSTGRLLFGVSTDDGITWALGTTPLIDASAGLWDAVMYRSTMVPSLIDGQLGYDVWYGANGTQGWQVGRSRIYSESVHALTTSGAAHGAFDIANINVLAAMKGLSPYVFGHSFSAADSTTSVGAADTGQSTATTTGTWGISSGKAYISSAANSRLIWNPGLADCVVDVDISGGISGDAAWVILRYVDASNYLRVGPTFGGSTALQTIVAGSATTLVSFGTGSFNGHYRVVANATSISVYRSGTLLGSATTSQFQTATMVGVQTATTTPRFDNFTVRSLVNGA